MVENQHGGKRPGAGRKKLIGPVRPPSGQKLCIYLKKETAAKLDDLAAATGKARSTLCAEAVELMVGENESGANV